MKAAALRKTPDGRRLLRAARRYEGAAQQHVGLALDATFDQAKARKAFAVALAEEKRLARQLMKVTRQVAEFIRTTFDTTILEPENVWTWLQQFTGWTQRYSQTLEPWAEAVVDVMHKRIKAQNDADWKRMSNMMGRALHEEILRTPTNSVLAQLKTDQVNLIKDIPYDMRQRVWDTVYKYTTEGLESSARFGALADELKRIGLNGVKATLIARTETARTASVLTEVRARNAGSPGYRWQSMHDGRTRPMHLYLHNLCNNHNKLIRWGTPPECDAGHHAHAGQIWNCRCHEAPFFPLPGEIEGRDYTFATEDELAFRGVEDIRSYRDTREMA
jgi:uncharacterized protein with gpF-like domain